jgi:hypothetical protein
MGPQVKGIAYRSSLRALEHLRGPDVVEASILRLPEELAGAIRFGTLIAAGWYPIEWYCALFHSIVEATGEGKPLVQAVARESARLDMVGIYRTAFKLLSPQALFNVSARLFSNYYDTGQLAIVESRSGFAHAKWSGCSGFDQNLWTEVFAASAMYLELAGATDITTTLVSGGGSSDDHAELQAHWT